MSFTVIIRDREDSGIHLAASKSVLLVYLFASPLTEERRNRKIEARNVDYSHRIFKTWIPDLDYLQQKCTTSLLGSSCYSLLCLSKSQTGFSAKQTLHILLHSLTGDYVHIKCTGSTPLYFSSRQHLLSKEIGI